MKILKATLTTIAQIILTLSNANKFQETVKEGKLTQKQDSQNNHSSKIPLLSLIKIFLVLVLVISILLPMLQSHHPTKEAAGLLQLNKRIL